MRYLHHIGALLCVAVVCVGCKSSDNITDPPAAKSLVTLVSDTDCPPELGLAVFIDGEKKVVDAAFNTTMGEWLFRPGIGRDFAVTSGSHLVGARGSYLALLRPTDLAYTPVFVAFPEKQVNVAPGGRSFVTLTCADLSCYVRCFVTPR